MKSLSEIDDQFVNEYILFHRTYLSKPTMGGTDWRFADIVAPAFKEILEITDAESVLEIGFNVGGSALMFLKINPNLFYDSIDIVQNIKSVIHLQANFSGFDFHNYDSKTIAPEEGLLMATYDLVFIDGDHSPEGVWSDIEKALLFKPKYLLLDDYRHPSHDYIEKMVTEGFVDKLEVIKVFEFNQCWQGYSMCLTKVK